MNLRCWFHSLPLAKDSDFLKKTGYLETISLCEQAKYYDGTTLLPDDEGFLKFIDSCGESLSLNFFVIPVIRNSIEVVGLILKGVGKSTFKYCRNGFGYIFIERDISPRSRVILVEGIKDAFIPVKCKQNVLVLLGTSIPKGALDIIKGRRVFSFLDNDSAGIKAFWNIKKTLDSFKTPIIQGKIHSKFKDLGDCFNDRNSFESLYALFIGQM